MPNSPRLVAAWPSTLCIWTERQWTSVYRATIWQSYVDSRLIFVPAVWATILSRNSSIWIQDEYVSGDEKRFSGRIPDEFDGPGANAQMRQVARFRTRVS